MSDESMVKDKKVVLEVKGLVTQIESQGFSFDVVRKVDFDLFEGEVLGIVGESGCGKSMLGNSILNLLKRGISIKEGTVILSSPDKSTGSNSSDSNSSIRQTDLTTLSPAQLRKIRGNDISMIFQDPMISLNPVLTIEEQMLESIFAHQTVTRQQAYQKCLEVMQLVGIPSPKERMKDYPHQFSGGMKQRVVIAIAFLNEPRVIIADEPTTALDVTIQSQILVEVQKMVEHSQASTIWISHDLSLLSSFADRIMVMYAGEVVELGLTHDVLLNPAHPYTRALLKAIPALGESKLENLEGFPPNMATLSQGCAFRPRCKYATDICGMTIPLTEVSDTHQVRCCHYDSLAVKGTN